MKSITVMASFILLVALATALPASAGQSKSDICHITDSFDFVGSGRAVPTGHVITIPNPALASYIGHGDTVTFAEPLAEGTVVCLSVSDVFLVCFTDGTKSFKLIDGLGRFANTHTYSDADCGTVSGFGMTTFAAPDFDLAEEMCNLVISTSIESLDLWVDTDDGYNTPGDWWQCISVDSGPI